MKDDIFYRPLVIFGSKLCGLNVCKPSLSSAGAQLSSNQYLLCVLSDNVNALEIPGSTLGKVKQGVDNRKLHQATTQVNFLLIFSTCQLLNCQQVKT